MQARYVWLTDELITRRPHEGGVTYARFVQLVRTAGRARVAEAEQDWERAAFVGWHALASQGNKLSWKEYRQSLFARRQQVDLGPPISAAEALEHARKIMAMDSQRAVQA